MKKRVVRESKEIYLHDYGLDYSKNVINLERCFGRQRTLERMIKNRENKKSKLDDEISKLNDELLKRKNQIKKLSKFMSPSISIVRPNEKNKYKRYRCKVYLSFGNKKSRYIWINLGTEEMLKGKTKDELIELGRREFLRRIGQ